MSDRVLAEFQDKTQGLLHGLVREGAQMCPLVPPWRLKAFCIFIDGLDQISTSDGQNKLLELVLEMRGSLNLKMYVSSRPEPILQKHLGDFPTFRMHDLVHADILKLTSSILNSRLIDSRIDLSAADYQALTSQVCEMVEGVFLWVLLAVRNLVVGFDKEDGMEELEQRLSLIPSEL